MRKVTLAPEYHSVQNECVTQNILKAKIKHLNSNTLTKLEIQTTLQIVLQHKVKKQNHEQRQPKRE